MTMNTFYLNEIKKIYRSVIGLIGHIISISCPLMLFMFLLLLCLSMLEELEKGLLLVIEIELREMSFLQAC